MTIKQKLDEMIAKSLKTNDVVHKTFARAMRAKVADHLAAKGLARDADDEETYLKVLTVQKTVLERGIVRLKASKMEESEQYKAFSNELELVEKVLPKDKKVKKGKK